MSTPLVFIEAHDGKPTPGSLGVLAKARERAGAAAAVVCGPGAAAIAATLSAYGADETWYCEHADIDADLAGPQGDAVTFLVRNHGFDTVLFENSLVAADVAASLSARLDAGVNWDLQDLCERGGELVGVRLALNDTLAVDVAWIGETRLGVFRVGLFEPGDCLVAGQVRSFEPEFAGHTRSLRVAKRIASASADEAQLATADVIVAGGRGVRDKESFMLLEDLAHALGGAVAVTLAVVDRGWYPHSRQVGQTGQKVRPRLYIACGVSGALAHRVGMEKSGVIVAINSDPTAPIFGICDGGVVGDLHQIVPELTRLIGQARTAGTAS